jgi:polyhydroxyalkanoate synthesis regulator phasin
MSTMTKIAATTLAVTLFLGYTAPASAQTASDIELTRANIQKARQTIIAGAMNFTEDEALAFWPAYRDYRLDMARLGDRLVKLITEFVTAGAKLNDEQANRILDEYLDVKSKEVSVKQKHVKIFRKLLPPTKVARFFQLENKLDAVVNYDLAASVPLTH